MPEKWLLLSIRQWIDFEGVMYQTNCNCCEMYSMSETCTRCLFILVIYVCVIFNLICENIYRATLWNRWVYFESLSETKKYTYMIQCDLFIWLIVSHVAIYVISVRMLFVAEYDRWGIFRKQFPCKNFTVFASINNSERTVLNAIRI